MNPDTKDAKSDTTGEMLEDMGFWAYGLPFATALPDGDVMAVYYAGNGTIMNIHWARISFA